MYLIFSISTHAYLEKSEELNHQPAQIIVEAFEIELDFLMKQVETVYKFVAPVQLPPNFPSYVYPMSDVLSRRSCDSFRYKAGAMARYVTFVSLIKSTEKGPRYLGIHTPTIAQIRNFCHLIKKRPSIAVKQIDDIIFTTEAQPKLLKNATYHLAQDPTEHIATLQSDCSRAFMTATIHPDDHEFTHDKSTGKTALDPEWIASIAMNHADSWEPFNTSTEMNTDLATALDNSPHQSTFWHIEPSSTDELAGQVFVTGTPETLDPNESIESELPSG